MTYSIIDTPNNVAHAAGSLKTQGIKTVIRYLALGHSWKTVSTDEAHAIAEGGLRLGLVFEVDGKPHGHTIGKRDGHAAYMGAKATGAPQNSILWYAVDYDPSPTDMDGIIAAFKAFIAEVGPYYRVGPYCSGYCALKLVEAGVLNSDGKLPVWITQSLGFRGTRDYIKSGKWTLLQKLPTHIAGLDVDPDVANDNADIGDFVPFVGSVLMS